MMHVKQHGLDDIADIMLDACIHNKVYDVQCEDSRARWLFEMFKDRREYPTFRDSILRALESETNCADLGQMCEMAKEMALNGDEDAKQILRKCVLDFAKTPEKDGLGVEELVEVCGNSAVLDLGKIYGSRFLRNPDEDIISYGFCCDEGRQKLLIENSKLDPEIKAFWDYVVKSGYLKLQKRKELTREQIKANKRKHRRDSRKKYPLKKIVEDARNGIGEYPGYYVRFGKYATAKELEKISDLILTEQDEDVRMRLLWVFRRTGLPKIFLKLFNWANGEHEGLRGASIAALAQVTDKRVHKLARAKAKAGQILGADSEAIDLFIKNYKSGDAKLIINAIYSVKPVPDDAHEFSHSILNLTENYKDLQLTDALIWVYENTPCSSCRADATKGLNEIGALSQKMINECLWDGSEEIREFAKGLTK
ncbi:MAG: HEAT repeat domain-containing protein [Sedimentisphaerales bacterium]